MLDECFRVTHAIPRHKDSKQYKQKLFRVHHLYLRQTSSEDLVQAYQRANCSIYRMTRILAHMEQWWFYKGSVPIQLETAKLMQLPEVETAEVLRSPVS